MGAARDTAAGGVRAATRCPGCGLELPVDGRVPYEGYYHASSECWGVYTEVIGAEFGDAVLFGRAHQLTVDAYAVQHAGGPHPDKSVAVHLAGLHLALEAGHEPPSVPALLQRIARNTPEWPRFEPPAERGRRTVLDVALAGSPVDHARASRAWARDVWEAWSEHHAAVRAFASDRL